MDWFCCPECGERYDRDSDRHECPGSPGDRLDLLEEQVAVLQAALAKLEAESKPRRRARAMRKR